MLRENGALERGMDKRYIFRFILGTLARRHSPEVDSKTSPAETAQIKRSAYQERELAYPAHTCVDQPILSCPACLKWTGDGFATVRNNPQCFPGVTVSPELENEVTSVTASCSKTKINKPQQGNSYVDRRTKNMGYMPSLNAAPPIEPPEPPNPESITASLNSALVVEEDRSLTFFFVKSLKERGYTVRTARDTEEGLRLYRDFAPFRVVLIDYFVPKQIGTSIDYFKPQTHWAELATSIRDINQSQHMIIAALDYSNEDEVQRPTELGHLPLLTDTSDFGLQKLLERLEVEGLSRP